MQNIDDIVQSLFDPKKFLLLHFRDFRHVSSSIMKKFEEIQEIWQNWVPNWAERKMATILFTFRNENELSSQPLTTLISEMDAKTRKLKILFDGKQQV